MSYVAPVSSCGAGVYETFGLDSRIDLTSEEIL
jgi:hypothetical protein